MGSEAAMVALEYLTGTNYLDVPEKFGQRSAA